MTRAMKAKIRRYENQQAYRAFYNNQHNGFRHYVYQPKEDYRGAWCGIFGGAVLGLIVGLACIL